MDRGCITATGATANAYCGAKHQEHGTIFFTQWKITENYKWKN